MKTTTALVRPTAGRSSMLVKFVQSVIALFERIPHSLIALLGRFSIASVFWQSGQTKIQGLVIDLVGGEFHLGWPPLLNIFSHYSF